MVTLHELKVQSRMNQLRELGMLDEARLLVGALGVSFEDVFSKRRSNTIPRARHALMFLLRNQDPFRWSYPALGAFFDRDHTSAMHGVRMHAAREGLPIPGTTLARIQVDAS